MIKNIICLLFLLLFLSNQPAYSMHIMEGFLPFNWCLFWFIATLPFIFAGILAIQKKININYKFKRLLVIAGAFTFVLSALKIPSITGSCSHPTGVGLGAILFGPNAMSIVSCIVLLFQALLLAHGGLSTLGANVFSMGIVGPYTSWIIYSIGKKINISNKYNIFLAASLGNLFAYISTSIQLAVAFPSPVGGIWESLIKFLGIFALTQIPLAISEGLLTVVIINFLSLNNNEELVELGVFSKEA